MPAADPIVHSFPEGVDDNDDWDFDGAIGGEPAQGVGMKRMLLDLLDECRI